METQKEGKTERRKDWKTERQKVGRRKDWKTEREKDRNSERWESEICFSGPELTDVLQSQIFSILDAEQCQKSARIDPSLQVFYYVNYLSWIIEYKYNFELVGRLFGLFGKILILNLFYIGEDCYSTNLWLGCLGQVKLGLIRLGWVLDINLSI